MFLRVVEDWLTSLSLLNFLSYYHDKVESTWTYQCDPQTPDIRSDIVALSWCTWVYSFRLNHKEKPQSFTTHTPQGQVMEAGLSRQPECQHSPRGTHAQGQTGRKRTSTLHWKQTTREDPTQWAPPQREDKANSSPLGCTRVYKTEAENRWGRKGKKKEKTKNYNRARLVANNGKKKAGGSKSLDLIPLCFSEQGHSTIYLRQIQANTGQIYYTCSIHSSS